MVHIFSLEPIEEPPKKRKMEDENNNTDTKRRKLDTLEMKSEDLAALAAQIQQKTKELLEEVAEQYLQLQEDREAFEQEKAFAVKYPVGTSDVVELNVGGTLFSTMRSTLCSVEGTLLNAIFSGKMDCQRDKEGRYFIDRAPDLFKIILEYLRTGYLLWPGSEIEKQRLKIELEHFGFPLSDLPSTNGS